MPSLTVCALVPVTLFSVVMTEDHALDKLEIREANSCRGSGGWEVQDQEVTPDEGLFVTSNMF